MIKMLAQFIFAVLIAATLCAGEKRYDGYTLYEVFPSTEANVEYLMSLQENPSDKLEVQLWRSGNTKTSFDILVSPESKQAFLKELDDRQIRHQVKNENIQDSIDKENKPTSTHARAFVGLQNAGQFSKYMTLDEMNAFIQSLATNYPDIVQIEQLGFSYERRPIYVVKVSSKIGRNKPSIWIDGGIHSREWIAVSTTAYMLNKLVTGYSTDAKIKNLVDKATWYFVPVLNVDGYDYTHKQDRMWRKNRRPAPCNSPNCCPGVDLNRNFDHSFGGAGTSPDSCQDSYRGKSAFSEPETQAVRDFVLKHTGDMKAFITIHAYSQMWFVPFANARQSYPPDYDQLMVISKKAAQAIQSLYGTEMQVGTPADILYPAAGGSFDWVKGVAKIKFCFGMELRPSQRSFGNGFVLPTSNIVPAGEETWAGVNVVADEVIRQFAK